MIRSKLLLSALIAPFAVFAAMGCGSPTGSAPSSDTGADFGDVEGPPVDGGWLVAGLDSEPAHLNPAMGTAGAVGAHIASYVYDRLLRIDYATLELKPNLATAWEVSDDKLTYTFELRDDVFWSDGVKFTAEDVKFTYEAVMNPAHDTAEVRNYLQDIERVEILDEFSVRYHMKKPYFRHLIIFGSSETTILPKHIFEAGDFNHHPNSRAPIGTGPYKFVSWDTGEQIELERNERYWGEGGHVDRILFKIFTDRNAAFQVLQQGGIDSYELTNEQFVKQANTPEFNRRFHKLTPYSPYPGWTGSYGWIGWNMRKPMFSDKRVRQALTMLLDRESILEYIYYDLGTVISGDAFIESEEYDDSIEPWPFDPERAHALLDEAGWKDTDGDGIRDKGGQPFRFEFSYTSGVSEYDQMTTVYQEELERAGIRMELRPYEWATFQDRVHKRNFDACMMAWVLDVGHDPYQLWHSSQADTGSNFVGFRHDEADGIMDRIRVEFDKDKRVELAHRFHAILHEEQPYTFTLTRRRPFVVNRRLQNVKEYKLGYDYLDWWIPEDRRKYE